MAQLLWVWDNLNRLKRTYICCLFSTAILAFMQLINPIISQKIVDDVLLKLPEYQNNLQPLIHTLYQLVIAMILFTLLRTTMQYLSIVTYEQVAQKFLFQIKNELFDKLQSQDTRFYSQTRTGDLMTRLTGDMDMIRHTICWVVRMLIECVVLFVAVAIYMFSKDVLFALSMMIVTPFIFLATRMFSKQAGPMYVALREKLSLLNTRAQENIAGNKVVKAFAREQYEEEVFDQKNNDYREANLAATMVWLKFYPAIEGLSQAMMISVLLVGGLFLMSGRISSGTFLAFNSLSWALSNPMRTLGMLMNDLHRFFASCDKIIELYYSQPDIRNSKKITRSSGTIRGKISFQDACVTMHGTSVLDHINLEIEPGETLVIMGSTGAGKTTLINTIARFVDLSQGKLLIDGTPVKEYDLHFLRKNIGLANQDVFLFSDTIEGNIAYGNLDMSMDDVYHFANMAEATFIERTEQGYDTLIGERGTGLSGGQKQRIALARALATRPSILILDDTTSAVDMETEKAIQQHLKSLGHTCTKIIIAQRISTAKNADKIAVMDQGKIIEYGTHEELLQKNGYYKEVYDLQCGSQGR
ncbi:MAG: ABC transporter ATP-binding protein [Massiliimalia sp.]|jgi:ATP-binding cassette subfamily B multidrug efflux pump